MGLRQLKYGKIFGIKRKEEIFCETDIGCVNCAICEKTYIKDKAKVKLCA